MLLDIKKQIEIKNPLIDKKYSMKKYNEYIEDDIFRMSSAGTYTYYDQKLNNILETKISAVEYNDYLLCGKDLISKTGNNIMTCNNIIETNNYIIIENRDRNYTIYDKNWNLIDRIENVKIISANNDRLIFINDKNKYGLMDINGNIIIKAKYDNLQYLSDDIYKVKKENNSIKYGKTKYGIINSKGNTILSIQYDNIEYTSDKTFIVNTKNNYLLFDNLGRIITDNKYDFIASIGNNKYHVERNKKVGMINKVGEIIIPIIYDKLGKISEGLISFKKNNECGYLNIKGEDIIKLSTNENISSLGDFENGNALVNLNNNHCYLIDRYGIQKSKEYNSIEKEDNYLWTVKDKNLYSVIDIMGNEIVPLSENKPVLDKDSIMIMENSNSTIYDKKGNKLMNTNYDNISKSYHDKRIVTKNGKVGIVNNLNEEILPPRFRKIILFKNPDLIFVDDSLYDINNLELSYNIVVSGNYETIVKKFDNIKEREKYYLEFINEYNNFIDKTNIENKVKKRIK